MTNLRIENHRLVADEGIPFLLSPNRGRNENKDIEIIPELLIIHYTAGSSGYSSVRWLLESKAQASAHLVIGRDGHVWQLVPFHQRAWACGASKWEGRSDVNSFSISIELDNEGLLTQRNGHWVTSYNGPVHMKDVGLDEKGRGWRKYTSQQITAATEIGRLLVKTYKLKDVTGHEVISPGRKIDPGPMFPMNQFRIAVL